LAVALIAADAQVRLHGRNASRTVALFDLYVEPSATPQIETVVEPGELIAEVVVPPLPGGEASRYLKLRERASYEFALVSVAAAVVLAEGTITSARIGVGGVATKPWRARETEDALIGVEIENVTALERAAAAALADARPLRDNGFKVELARRAIMRAVRQAAGVA
jgi:xanthine dehydrogenase YagS FAD-binding subunit